LLGDIPIDRYVRVNVQAVEKLVDALGGVTVHVPKRMKYQDDSQHLYINLYEGEQHLDGDKTLQLLRFRKDSMGDIGRIQRQQMVTRALIEQSLKPQTILKIPEILAILQAHIDTNLNMEELVAIAGLAAQTDRSNVQMLMLPGDFSGNGRRAISYWLPNMSKIQTLMLEYFALNSSDNSAADPLAIGENLDSTSNGENITNKDSFDAISNKETAFNDPANSLESDNVVPNDSADNSTRLETNNLNNSSNSNDPNDPANPVNFPHSVTITSTEGEEISDPQDPRQVRIAIQDSLNNSTATRALVTHLQNVGYSRITIVDNWRHPLKITRIIAPQGDGVSAAKVRNQLGLGEVLIDSNGYLVSDVTIQVGLDWVERGQTLSNSY
ncbi:MAG: LCP family protein, partial [Microcystaceae cyanobacterium]